MKSKTQDTHAQLFEPDLNFCSCGCEAELVQEANPDAQKKRKRHVVRCLDSQCGNQGRYNTYAWQAVLDWNKSPCSDFPEFLEIPFLSFTGMTYREIQDSLRRIRSDHESQVKQLKADKKTMREQDLKVAKVKLLWTIYAQSWAKYMSFQKSEEMREIA